MKTVFPVHRFPVASSFERILLSAAVCISDEALYAVVDPFDDFECIGFVKNSSLLFIRNESSSFLIIYEANRKNFNVFPLIFVRPWTKFVPLFCAITT